MATKHEQILQHILSLQVGSKISVRQIAKDLNVSDGTAYRAIKEAENQGIVSTIERVGTIRIEQKKKENFEELTFAEVVNIIDGQVLGGRDGLHKTLSKFVIGAMELNAMMRYTQADSLLIVGNRLKAHKLALEAGAAVLITGGFDADDAVKQLANEKQLPIISTSYDTFTVAAMINRAIYDQLIKKEIVFVGDISTPFESSYYLTTKQQVKDWYINNEVSSHTRFPVVDDRMKVVGVVSSRDIVGKDQNTFIDRIMSRKPLVVQKKTSLASVAHMMVWEGIELVPVVDGSHVLKGVISRQDVLKAMQQIQRQPQVGETIEDIVSNNMSQNAQEEGWFEAHVIPQMTNHLGTLSHGVFTALITEACEKMMKLERKAEISIENITVYFSKPVPIDSILHIKPTLLDVGRLYAKIDVEVLHGQKTVGKALIMAQLINR
ncbi:DRTGG domain-containing protein [Oceanobacillus sp. J11TS1]|uniref:DRTGG domain-containing protein n=1 Tax=Oceanobacillus sp. J11TS1 TaxID=2807191 RepID=UPI001B286126|nr:DRTGG domain-containing protein [Oceanobacillus sp. J11TS1]GIO22405.1 thioesterase [Oceanobacillus sp. J11TS1]